MNKTKIELIGMINEANTRIEALERDILLFSKNPKISPKTSPTKCTIQKRTFKQRNKMEFTKENLKIGKDIKYNMRKEVINLTDESPEDLKRLRLFLECMQESLYESIYCSISRRKTNFTGAATYQTTNENKWYTAVEEYSHKPTISLTGFLAKYSITIKSIKE